MKKNFFRYKILLFMLILSANNLFAQYDNPNLDQVPQQYLDYLSTVSPKAPLVVTDNSGYDNFDIGTAFAEVHAVMNPRNPLQSMAAWNTTAGSNLYYTLNGIDWALAPQPAWGQSMRGDPVLAYDSLGNLYYENMVGGITGTRVIKSVHGGVSFGAGVAANTGNDKNWLAADQTNGPYKNYIYTVMTPGNFKRSTNGGTSFVQTFSAANGLPGNMVCVGANKNGATNVSGGAVYFVISTGSAFAATYTFYCSNDGGATFSLKSSQNYAGYVGTDVAGRNSVQNMRTRP